ncbi:dephospho-CoA kinase [Geopsychrobacter electrodiphilus]|uniref:dephospho-CoA kinase n=1 Tax=Geopsychrobacter electrodiphilus TaxID=225196 RepID=UPI000371573D|nr:dephospho-CoA kinase [Geopsychrobacter electrodiphilus]
MGKTILILGITGSIATGKSLVTELLRQKGAAVLSADQLARDVVAPGTETLAALVKMFGPQILTRAGALDRECLGRLVFADAEARQKMNKLMHPAIAQLAEDRLAVLAQTGVALVVYEAPLLYEAGAEKRVDKVLVVTLDPGLQLSRLVERDHLDVGEALQRIQAQMSQAEKKTRADYLIDNSGSLHDLQIQVDRLWAKLVG